MAVHYGRLFYYLLLLRSVILGSSIKTKEYRRNYYAFSLGFNCWCYYWCNCWCYH
nr:MAG TPA: hypothetical protein [Caudoviricetes sp.]